MSESKAYAEGYQDALADIVNAWLDAGGHQGAARWIRDNSTRPEVLQGLFSLGADDDA